VPYYHRLSPDERNELHGHIQVFLFEKDFEGCGGLEITDEIRVTIAAQACLLLLNRETNYFPLMSSVLVYPSHYYSASSTQLPGGLVQEEIEALDGESWHRGPIVLSWDDVLHGAADPDDGDNVVFHEFAHQLDNESDFSEGVPKLPKTKMYAEWARIFGDEYNNLRDDLKRHRQHLIGADGASSPAEFFAVATEIFFEKSRQLRKHHPELYRQLVAFFRQDPALRQASDTE